MLKLMKEVGWKVSALMQWLLWTRTWAYVSSGVLLTSLSTRDCTPQEFWWFLLSWYMWETGNFARELEPSVGVEQLWRKPNKRAILILNYQKGVCDTYIFTFSRTDWTNYSDWLKNSCVFLVDFLWWDFWTQVYCRYRLVTPNELF